MRTTQDTIKDINENGKLTAGKKFTHRASERQAPHSAESDRGVLLRVSGIRRRRQTGVRKSRVSIAPLQPVQSGKIEPMGDCAVEESSRRASLIAKESVKAHVFSLRG